MRARLQSLVATVIRRASRNAPADAVLREELKRQSGLSAADSHAVSRAVFVCFRWHGWLDQEDSIARQVEQAIAMDERFRLEPAAFADHELISKSVPAWIGEHLEISPAWVRALQTEPQLWLRSRLGHGPELARSLGGCVGLGAGRLADALCYAGSTDLFCSREFQAGEFELQDLSSQAVGWLCNPQPVETWWDVCAGEGGKTLHLAELMDNHGLIWATDRSQWRLQRLQRRAARAQVFNYRMRQWDASAALPFKTKFDGVLVDAPCTGVGTWHRNPQARWTTEPRDVQELAEIQQRILDWVAPAVKPDGKLVYSVCTLTRAETVEAAVAFEARHPEFKPLPQPSPFPPTSPPQAQHWFWPQDHGGNGMFVATWRKSASAAGS